MTSGLDKLIDEVIRLRCEVEGLRGKVTALRHLVADQNGELVALKIMLTAWPVQPPDPPQALH